MKMSPAALSALSKGEMDNFVAASTPGGIEAQEAAGQKTLCESSSFPKDLGRVSEEQLEAIGFIFGEDIDDIFVSVTLPSGWKIVPTSHSMHNDLIDDKGRRRGGIFYKAASYDRHSDLSMDSRYLAYRSPEDEYKSDLSYEERKNGKWFGFVKDCGSMIWKTEAIKAPTFEQEDDLTEEARVWLTERYPDYENPFAYWD
jgi:hypothetical protein